MGLNLKDNKSKICNHNSVTGQTYTDWICNLCDFIYGSPDERSFEIYKKLKLTKYE